MNICNHCKNKGIKYYQSYCKISAEYKPLLNIVIECTGYKRNYYKYKKLQSCI